MTVIPGLTAEELRARAMRDLEEPEEDKRLPPNPFHITKADLERWGYTAGCRRCTLVRERRKGHGVRHVPECRQRIERMAREEDDPRIRRMDAKNDEYNEQLARRIHTTHSEGGVDRGAPPARKFCSHSHVQVPV